MNFVIITGLSGAGKTAALHAMEDIGYYCVDNLPSNLLRTFYNLCLSSTDKAMKKVAVVIDVRGGDNMQSLFADITAFRKEKKKLSVVFLDANFNTLVTRFKETRRRHPLTDLTADNSMEAALALESTYLNPFKKLADHIIDTTHINVKQLKERISALFLGSADKSIVLTFLSFGFKYGIPNDCDSVFDVRCLPNPFYVPELRGKTGLDREVYDYVFKSEDTRIFVDNLLSFLDFAVPLYIREGKTEFVAGIGCTGGRHRSVAIADLFKNHFTEKGYKSLITHRDMNK